MELSNHFLIAGPQLKDTLFSDSVIYITDHGEYIGAIGVIINKPVGHALDGVFDNINIADYNKSLGGRDLYWGGPMKAKSGFYLRQVEDNLQHDKYELTGDKDYLKKLSDENGNLFMSMGYSMWSAMQLELEIMNNIWIVAKSKPEIIFNTVPGDRYSEALKSMGILDVNKLYGNIEGFAYS